MKIILTENQANIILEYMWFTNPIETTIIDKTLLNGVKYQPINDFRFEVSENEFRLLLKMGIQFLKRKGFDSVELSVFNDNFNALKLYEKLGFKEVKRNDMYQTLSLSFKKEENIKEIEDQATSEIPEKDFVFKVLKQRFELYDGERLIAECSFQPLLEGRGVHLWGFRVKKDLRNKGIGSGFLEKILGYLQNKVYVVIADIVNSNFESVRLYKKFGFKIHRKHDYTSTVYKTFNNEEDVDLDEQLTYFEDPHYKENDIYDYEPSDEEVERFYRQYFGKPSVEPKHHSSDNPIKKKKIKKDHVVKSKKDPALKRNGYAFLRKLGKEVGYGPIGLMKWRKNEEMNANPILGAKYEVVPDFGEIKLHDTTKYFH